MTIKIEFAPGCFDHFDGSQEELDQLIAEIQAMADSGQLAQQATPLTEESYAEMTEDERLMLETALGNPWTRNLLQ